MTIHQKFDDFIAQYALITNEAIALKTLKEYMFSLNSDEMVAFMQYTQSSLFKNYDQTLENAPNVLNSNAVAQQISDLENLIKTDNNVLKAA